MATENLWTLASSQTKDCWLTTQRPVPGLCLGNKVPSQRNKVYVGVSVGASAEDFSVLSSCSGLWSCLYSFPQSLFCEL